MWEGDFSTAGQGSHGGGFFDNPNRIDSPGTGKKQDAPKRAQSLTPVVIGMLQDSQEDEFKIWGSPTHILKIVGIVRKFDVTSTKVTYEIEDHTGRIPAVLWLEQDAMTQPKIPVDREGVYVNVYGTLRNKGGDKLIMILRIAPITSMNEPTTHLLEVIHVRFRMEKASHGEDVIRSNHPGSELSNSMMSFSHGGSMNMEEDGMNPIQLKVFKLIKTATTRVGMARSNILDQFPQQNHREATNAIDFLVSEGHVFSTIDNDHFKLTDSA